MRKSNNQLKTLSKKRNTQNEYFFALKIRISMNKINIQYIWQTR